MNTTLKRALYLDDKRTPTTTIPGYHPWEVVRNYDEFAAHIDTHGIPDLISFDHDLHQEHMDDYFDQVAKIGWQAPSYDQYQHKTGIDCAKYVVDYCQSNPQAQLNICTIHSANPVGSHNIRECLNEYKKYRGWPANATFASHPFTVEPE